MEAGPEIVSRLGGDEEFIPVRHEIRRKNGRNSPPPSPGGCVIVSQVKMGDAQVKGPAKNLPLFFQGLFQAEIVPEAQEIAGEGAPAPAAAAGISWCRTGFLLLYTYRFTCFLGILLNAGDRSQDLPDPAVNDQVRLGIPGGSVLVDQHQFAAAVTVDQAPPPGIPPGRLPPMISNPAWRM